jgi:hypothetical protein
MFSGSANAIVLVGAGRVGEFSGSTKALLAVEVGWVGVDWGLSSTPRGEEAEQPVIIVPINPPAAPTKASRRNARRPSLVRVLWLIIAPLARCFLIYVSPFSELLSQ